MVDSVTAAQCITYVRPFFQATYEVTPAERPGIRYSNLEFSYRRETVVAGDLGASVSESQELVADNLSGTFCSLYLYRPVYVDDESILEFRYDFDRYANRPSLVHAALHSTSTAEPDDDGASTDTILGHLRRRLLDRFEVDLISSFGGEDSSSALTACRDAWSLIPVSEKAPPYALLRRVLFNDIVEILRGLPAAEHAH